MNFKAFFFFAVVLFLGVAFNATPAEGKTLRTMIRISV